MNRSPLKPSHEIRPPARGRLRSALGTAATWGLLCWVLALPWTLGAADFGFPPVLLALLAGALWGVTFVNWLFACTAGRIGLAVKCGAVLTVIVFFTQVGAVSHAIEGLPKWATHQAFFLLLAFCPFGALVVKVVLYGLIDAMGSATGSLLRRLNLLPASTPSPTKTARWDGDHGRSFMLEIDALRWNMRALVTTIIALVLLGGGLSVVLMIALDLHFPRVPTSLVVIICAIVGLVLAGLFGLMTRAHRHTWKIVVDPERICASCGLQMIVFPLDQLVLVQLRQRTDYARLVLATASDRLSLFTNLLASDKSSVPPLPREVERWLRAAGLVEQQSKKNPDLTLWRRVH